MDTNSDEAIHQRLDTRTITWRGPTLVLFSRAAFAIGAQALVAGVFALDLRQPPGMKPSLGCLCMEH